MPRCVPSPKLEKVMVPCRKPRTHTHTPITVPRAGVLPGNSTSMHNARLNHRIWVWLCDDHPTSKHVSCSAWSLLPNLGSSLNPYNAICASQSSPGCMTQGVANALRWERMDCYQPLKSTLRNRLDTRGSYSVSLREAQRQRHSHGCDIEVLRAGVGHLRREFAANHETSLVYDRRAPGFNTDTVLNGAVGARFEGIRLLRLCLFELCLRLEDHPALRESLRATPSCLHRKSAPPNKNHW